MTQQDLEKLFSPFGAIITSRILSDNVTGLSKGVGFVRYDRRQEAEAAIAKLNGVVPVGGVDPITVKFANNPAANTQKTGLQVINVFRLINELLHSSTTCTLSKYVTGE